MGKVNSKTDSCQIDNTITSIKHLERGRGVGDILTPYKEAPALKVSLKARAANVVYPPAEPPVIQSRLPSTLPLPTCQIKQIDLVLQHVGQQQVWDEQKSKE